MYVADSRSKYILNFFLLYGMEYNKLRTSFIVGFWAPFLCGVKAQHCEGPLVSLI